MSDNIVYEVKVQMATDFDTVAKNVKDANKRKLVNICDLPEWRNATNVALVGGGSSLKKTVDKLNKFKYVMVCGSAHDYVVSQGITPKWTVICDPDPLVSNYLKNVIAGPYHTYLISSHCHPSVFDYLLSKNAKVSIWHTAGSDTENKIFSTHDVLIGGGCTVGTRAITIAINFGYNKLHLFGFDTCISNDESHAYPFDNPETEKLTDIREVTLGDKKFKVAGYMMAQFFDFQHILKTYGKNTEFIIHGDGLLKSLMDLAIDKTINNNEGTV